MRQAGLDCSEVLQAEVLCSSPHTLPGQIRMLPGSYVYGPWMVIYCGHVRKGSSSSAAAAETGEAATAKEGAKEAEAEEEIHKAQQP